MGKRKHHMKVRGINDLGSSFIHPDLLQDRLAVRAVTVAAGVVVKFHVSTVCTLADVAAKVAGFTVSMARAAFSCIPDI